jgi:hypothetical protein
MCPSRVGLQDRAVAGQRTISHQAWRSALWNDLVVHRNKVSHDGKLFCASWNDGGKSLILIVDVISLI